jgi:hypothetical protein
MTVTKKPDRRGERAKETVKTIACGNAGCSGATVVTTLACFLLHAGPRVRRAPGIPHALCFFGRMVHAQLGRYQRRGIAQAYLNKSDVIPRSESDEAIQASRFDWIASVRSQ